MMKDLRFPGRFIAAFALLAVFASAVVLVARRDQAPGQKAATATAAKSSQRTARNSDDQNAVAQDSAWKPRLTPSAAWLAAEPTPLLVSFTAESQTANRRVSPGGGELSVVGEDRTRTTLYVPPEALPRSRDLKLAPIKSVSGLPFAAGLVAAVEIGPNGGPFDRPLKAIFEIRQPLPQEESIAGFAIRGGRELHLYPARRVIDPQLGKRVQFDMPIAGPGVYGIAKASLAEIEAVAGHVPTDRLARLAQHIALAWPPVAPARAGAAFPSLFRFVSVQAAEPLPPWLRSLFRYVEEMFEQLVVPMFEQISQTDCQVHPTELALETYGEWATLTRMLFPIELADYRGLPMDIWSRDYLKRQAYLRERGYSDPQIAALDEAMDSFRREKYNALLQRGILLSGAEYVRLFEKLSRCCSKQEHVDAMGAALRQAALLNMTIETAFVKLMECSCRVRAKENQSWAAFLGKITHTEEYTGLRLEKLGTTVTREVREEIHSTYRDDIELTVPHGPWVARGSYTVAAFDERSGHVKDTKSCGVVSSEHKETISAHDGGEAVVAVKPVPGKPGTYHIEYMPHGADGYGNFNTHWSALGCQIFNPVRDRNWGSRASISGYPMRPVVIEAKVEPSRPFELRGSRQLEEPDNRKLEPPHRPKVEWNLRRCGSQ